MNRILIASIGLAATLCGCGPMIIMGGLPEGVVPVNTHTDPSWFPDSRYTSPDEVAQWVAGDVWPRWTRENPDQAAIGAVDMGRGKYREGLLAAKPDEQRFQVISITWSDAGEPTVHLHEGKNSSVFGGGEPIEEIVAVPFAQWAPDMRDRDKTAVSGVSTHAILVVRTATQVLLAETRLQETSRKKRNTGTFEYTDHDYDWLTHSCVVELDQISTNTTQDMNYRLLTIRSEMTGRLADLANKGPGGGNPRPSYVLAPWRDGAPDTHEAGFLLMPAALPTKSGLYSVSFTYTTMASRLHFGDERPALPPTSAAAPGSMEDPLVWRAPVETDPHLWRADVGIRGGALVLDNVRFEPIEQQDIDPLIALDLSLRRDRIRYSAAFEQRWARAGVGYRIPANRTPNWMSFGLEAGVYAGRPWLVGKLDSQAVKNLYNAKFIQTFSLGLGTGISASGAIGFQHRTNTGMTLSPRLYASYTRDAQLLHELMGEEGATNTSVAAGLQLVVSKDFNTPK